MSEPQVPAPEDEPQAAAGQAGAGQVGASQSRALVPAPRQAVVARDEFAAFLPDVEAVTEQRHSPVASLLIVAVAGFVLAALVWAHFARVEQVAVAGGVVRPQGQIKTINHPEGGRVAEILVAESTAVEAGQALIRLDGELLSEKAAQLNQEWQSLAAEVARLEAEAEGVRNVDLPEELAAGRPDLLAAQTRLLRARLEATEMRRATADQVVEQRQGEAAALQESRKRVAGTLAILREQEAAVRELVAKGYYPRLRYLEIEREISEYRGQIAELDEQLAAAYSALEEAKTQRLGLDREVKAEALDELQVRRRERDRTLSELQQSVARLRNLEIRAPVAGVIQDLKVTGPGQSVRPSEPIMSLVPSGEGLVIEARVSNADIGHVRLGQKATVKVVTYDYLRHGALEGAVTQIAADATEDEETNELAFKVVLRTDRNHLGGPGPGRGGSRLPVQPGMLVTVDLHIGERSILSYLTDRILHTTTSAFRER